MPKVKSFDEKYPKKLAPPAVSEEPNNSEIAEEPAMDVSMQPREVQIKRWPSIIRGVCEFCGIVDKNVQGWEQWKHCKHYKKVDIKCLYCPPGQDPDEWFKGRTLTVIERLDRPGKLNVYCDDIRCETKFFTSWKA